MLAVVCIRLGTVVQMTPSLPEGVSLSPRPLMYGLLWALAAATSLSIAVVVGLRRRLPSTTVTVVDVAATALFLLLGGLVITPELRINTWVGWPPAYALSVLLSTCSTRSRPIWTLALTVVVTTYVVYAFPSLVGYGTSGTVVGNVLTQIVLGSVGRFLVGFLRRAAIDADQARVAAGRSARAAEAARARVTMHNATTIMQLLSDPGLPESLRGQLQVQALSEARRMRSYLRSDPLIPDVAAQQQSTEDVLLIHVLTDAMRGFDDLGLEPSLILADQVRLAPTTAAAVHDAITALLHNVRVHAKATRVVIHAEQDASGSWTVTVRDNGRGYDPATTRQGVGLRDQVIGQLTQHGIGVSLTSAPGDGTRIVLSSDRRATTQ